MAGPYGPESAKRLIIVTTDPAALPEESTFYLRTNLPAPGSSRAQEGGMIPADVAEIVRLYGLRVWVEQSYKQVKGSLGWAQYQVRSDMAMRRHWQLVCCAFSFCWWALPGGGVAAELDGGGQPVSLVEGDVEERAGGKRKSQNLVVTWPQALRRVRAWLEPYLLLRRYWQAWSVKPPPQRLQRLLDWLFDGRPIHCYAR